MNYIELINRFWCCSIERASNPSDCMLYFYLLNTCNALHWKQPFGQSDRHLGAILNMSVNTIRDSKNRLKQMGLIEFKAPEKASRGVDGQTKYSFPKTVSKNDTVSDTVTQTVSKFDTDTDTVIDTVPDTVVDTVPDTNNKLKRSSCDRRSYEEPVVLMHCWDTYGFCALNWMFLMALSGIAREEYKRIWQ